MIETMNLGRCSLPGCLDHFSPALDSGNVKHCQALHLGDWKHPGPTHTMLERMAAGLKFRQHLLGLAEIDEAFEPVEAVQLLPRSSL